MSSYWIGWETVSSSPQYGYTVRAPREHRKIIHVFCYLSKLDSIQSWNSCHVAFYRVSSAHLTTPPGSPTKSSRRRLGNWKLELGSKGTANRKPLAQFDTCLISRDTPNRSYTSKHTYTIKQVLIQTDRQQWTVPLPNLPRKRCQLPH